MAKKQLMPWFNTVRPKYERVMKNSMSFQIIGTGSAYPVCIKTNDELSQLVDTTDEWISSRTGIKSRHISTTESLSELAVTAAKQALEDANVKSEELSLIICATIQGDYVTPSLACVVQKEIGAKCPAFDVNAACSGFIYGLDIALGYYERKKADKVLIIAAETMSKHVNWKDRATCVLFGDGAGAVVLSAGDGLVAIKTTASGATDILTIPGRTGNNPFSEPKAIDDYLYMNGPEVFKFAVTSMCRDLKDVIAAAGLTETEIDMVLPHQANLKIIEGAMNRLKIPEEKYYGNIEHSGNISAASIPILLDELNKAGLIKKGFKLALSSFGGGLTSAACVIKWNKEAVQK